MGIALGSVASRVGLPRLVGELAAGVILGPTVFGHVLPHAVHALFPPTAVLNAQRGAIVQLWLVLFLFSVGSHIDIPKLRSLRRRIVWTSFGGIAVPFAVGYASVFLFPALWSAHADRHALAFVIGAILSISALPVIAKILSDLGLLTTAIGTVIMAAATLDDLVGWSLFAVVSAGQRSAASPVHQPIVAVGVVLILFILTVIFGHRLAKALAGRSTGSTVSVRVLTAASMAALTEWLGLGAVFGAFLAGIAFADSGASSGDNAIIDRFAGDIFAPLYFVSVGLQTDFAQNFSLMLVVYMILVACIGKIIGATAGARLGGAEPRVALAIGFGLNARGAMAIVLVTAALQRGLVSEPVFVAVVITSLVTSLISGPIVSRFAKLSELSPKAT